MKKTTLMIAIALGLFIILFVIDTPARGSSMGRTASVRSFSNGFQGSRVIPGRPSGTTFRGNSPGVGYREGFSKSAAGANAGWRGYREAGNQRRYYGHHGWGSPWPYWSVGVYLTYLPDDYTIVNIDGTPYYYCDGSYFASYANGYLVVPAPEPSASEDQQAPVQASSGEQQLAAVPNSATGDTTTVNVPNSKGGFTSVRLVKQKNGYVGPQGEFYAGHPTVAALKALYGD
jgi:hypothetical protein